MLRIWTICRSPFSALPSLRCTLMICASMNHVFFIGISSFIPPRKFYFRILLRPGDYPVDESAKS